MKRFISTHTLQITLTAGVFALLLAGAVRYGVFVEKHVSAGVGDNLSGFAWSSNTGWISMNSANCDSSPEDGLSDGSPAGCPVAGTSIPDYGVNINNATGNFSGYAWSSNIGWIDFAPTSGFPETPNHGAHLESDGTVTGWIKASSGGSAESGGWDGWIKMSGSWSNGVALTGTELCGYAWGSDVVGWVKFCADDTSWKVTFDEPATVTLMVNGDTGSTPVLVGENVDLTWATSNIQSETCMASDAWGLWNADQIDNRSVPLSVGPITDTPPNTFQLTCEDLFGNPVSSSVVLTMTPPNLSITRDPIIVRSGDTTTIAWDTGNVDPATCSISGPGAPGSIGATGSFNPTVTFTTTYTLDCGFASESVTVRVASASEEI